MSNQRQLSQAHGQDVHELQKIDLFYYMNDLWKKFKRLWWVPILLAMVFFGIGMLRFDWSYTPYYETSITAYVEMSAEKSDSYQNQLTASQMDRLFPYLMGNGLLEDAICTKMGVESLPGTITMHVDSNTNLLNFVATGDDPEAIHNMVLATVDVFPKTLSYIVGPTTFRTFKDMGVPKLPANNPPHIKDAIRSSVKRGVVGFLAGMVLILIFGAMNHTVETNKELKKILNVPMLGIIPLVKRRKKRPYALVDDAKVGEQFVESFRSLRNRFEREVDDRKVFMVTSTIPNEGKSTIAVNLALSLAAKGRKILLIDSDMRNPSISTIMGLAAEGQELPGLHEVLRGKCSLEKAMVKVENQDLFVLPAGSPTKNSADLICSPRMKQLLDRVRDHADYIIMDTPPVMVLSDSKALAGNVDGCIYVVRKETARVQAILANVSQLEDAGLKFIATVFNGSAGEEGGYSRSGKYGGYGKYGKYGRYGIYGHYGRKKH